MTNVVKIDKICDEFVSIPFCDQNWNLSFCNFLLKYEPRMKDKEPHDKEQKI